MEYVVVALAVSGSGNKIYRSGDTVTEQCFPRGNAEDLVKKGFIRVKEKPETTAKPVEGSVGANSIDSEKGTGLKTIEEISRKELIKQLTDKVEFDKNAPKEVLYKLWVELQK